MPSPVAGVMGEHKVKVGDTVEVGAVIATVEEGASAAAAEAEPLRASLPMHSRRDPRQAADIDRELDALPKGDEPEDRRRLAMSPAVRRAVLEHGVDPTTIKGTGKDGRLTKEDVLAAAAAKKAAPAPSVSRPRRPPPRPPRPRRLPASGARNGSR